MRAILIDPSNKSVSVVENKGDWKSICSAIGADAMCVALHIRTKGENYDTVWVDDNGLLTNPNPNGYFRLPGVGYPGTLAGKGLLLGNMWTVDGIDTDDAQSDLRNVWNAVEFIDNPEPESIEPRIEFRSMS